MNWNTLRRTATRAVVLALLGPLTAVNASAATRNRDKREPEKPLSGCLVGKVCADDVLRINVDEESVVSGRYRVDAAGGIDCPFVGRLIVTGLKPTAVAKLIADGLKKARMGEPSISVEIETDQKRSK